MVEFAAYQQPSPIVESSLSNKVELSFSCRNLVDLDTFSKSDPTVHVFIKDSRAGSYIKLGETERIDDNLNPDFVKTFLIDYFFEKEQWMKFEVYDVDGKKLEHIGTAETTVSKIMTAQRQTWMADLTIGGKSQSRGKIIVRADSVKNSNDEVSFALTALIIATQAGWCCGADQPYLMISRSRGGDLTHNEYI